MATSTIAHPIQTLREQATALEAAVTLCLAGPKPKPVHLLRTTTRRIEAQLTLLSLLPGLPPHPKPAKKARRLLKELRRAAGHVRDLDVQSDLIEEKTSASTRKESRQLRKTLKHQRTQAEANLIETLDKHQSKLTLAIESLLKALKPVESLTLTSTRLTALTQDWFAQSLPTHSGPDDPNDPDALHTIRKLAKLARYIVETAPKSARNPRKLAAAFESLQQSGGHWHDWLVLTDLAHNHLGSSSALTQTFRRHCQTALKTYQAHLSTPGLPPHPNHPPLHPPQSPPRPVIVPTQHHQPSQ
jgi:CHAD domain-containing protein